MAILTTAGTRQTKQCSAKVTTFKTVSGLGGLFYYLVDSLTTDKMTMDRNKMSL